VRYFLNGSEGIHRQPTLRRTYAVPSPCLIWPSNPAQSRGFGSGENFQIPLAPLKTPPRRNDQPGRGSACSVPGRRLPSEPLDTTQFKAPSGRKALSLTAQGKSKTAGRAAIGISGSSRSRYLLHFLDNQRSVAGLTHPSRFPSNVTGSTARRGRMALQPHRVERIFGMVLAIALTIVAITTWAFSPNPNSDPAVQIPPSEAIYRPQHWNAY
jgi:hypothetical protein